MEIINFLAAICVLTSFSFTAVQANAEILNGELIFAQVIWRHGARAPTTQPAWTGKHVWPEGLGQLTKIGKQQHYVFGQWLRQRYATLLDSSTDIRDTVYVRSTDSDRTLMSAELVNAALFPPVGEQIWNEHIHWQPVPVHTMPLEKDFVLYMSAPCATYDEAMFAYKQSDIQKERAASYQQLYEHLTEKTKERVKNQAQVTHVFDNLLTLSYYNITLPTWAQDADTLKTMKNIAADFFADLTNTPLLARLYAGPLIKELVEHFEQKAAGKLTPDRKLWLYSAHDTTIISVLNSLGLFERSLPKFSSSIFFELRRNEQIGVYLSIFFRNAAEEEPEPLVIPNCGSACPLEKFKQLYEQIMPKNFTEECGESHVPRFLIRYG